MAEDNKLSQTIPVNQVHTFQKKISLPQQLQDINSFDNKIIHYKTTLNKEKFEALLIRLHEACLKSKQITFILYDCELSFEVPKQIFYDFLQLEVLKLNFSCNSLKSSFLTQLKEALIGNKLKVFGLELSQTRDLNPDFFNVFDEKFFTEFKELTSLKLNFSDNSKTPENIDLKFLEKINKLEKLEKLNLDLSKNYFQHWKKLCKLFPDMKNLLKLKLNFYGCRLSIDYTLDLCNSLVRCDNLNYIKLDLRASVTSEQSVIFHEIAHIEAMVSIFREKFENDPNKFKIWY